MEKILLGIGLEEAEIQLKEIILRNNPENVVCDDAIIDKRTEHILEKIKNNNPTVVILRETLKGNDDIMQTIYYIKKYFDVRIIFIAKNRKPGDKLLATLVGYSIYDIIAGSIIEIEDIAKLVEKKNTFKDVSHLVPKPKDDNYDELLFESEETSKEEDKDDKEEEETRIRNPFGIIKRDKLNKVKEKVIDEEVEDDGLDIDNIFKNAKPTKPKKLFGKDIEEYKDSLLNEDDEEIKDNDNIEEGSNIENYNKIKKSPKTKRSMFKKKNNKIEKIIEKEELRAIIKEDSSNLNKQLKKFEEEVILDKEEPNEDLEENDCREKKEEIRNLDKELKIIRKLKKQREKERKKREKEELAIAERQKKLEEAEKLEQEKKEKEKEEFEKKMRERDLDIKEAYAKRSGIVINGSLLGTIWNKGKRFFIAISVSLVVSLILNLIMAYINGRNPYTAFLEYSNFVINLLKIAVTFLKKLFVVIGDLAKEIYIKIENS